MKALIYTLWMALVAAYLYAGVARSAIATSFVLLLAVTLCVLCSRPIKRATTVFEVMQRYTRP